MIKKVNFSIDPKLWESFIGLPDYDKYGKEQNVSEKIRSLIQIKVNSGISIDDRKGNVYTIIEN